MSENKPRYFFDLSVEENLVIGHIEGTEIFRFTFNPKNFVENFHKSVPIPKPTESLKEIVRSLLKRQNPELNGEELEAAVENASWEISKVMHEESTNHIASCISDNLARLSTAIMEDAVQAYNLDAAIQLNAQAGKPFSIAEFKKTILNKHWSRIRDLAGIKQGGARQRKGFVWTDEKKIEFYNKVESLPKHKGESVWQFTLDELIEQEFKAESISWLKTHPALISISEELFNKAIKAWRKYLMDENWKGMKEEDRPRAFEFRHALHLLDYPDENTYSTLETYYYEGKKISDNQT